MELLIMIGIGFFFGAVALSMLTQQSGPPPAPVFVVRSEPLERGASAESGMGIFVLLLVIVVAIWLF